MGQGVNPIPYMKELTIIKISATGQTNPHIPFGTDVLLIQDGAVQVGKLLQDPEDKDSVYIDHPKNQAGLHLRAMKIIKERRPEYLKSDIALTVICPADISKDMAW
jgi:hypothetical protein